jgi:hypothetical protein
VLPKIPLDYAPKKFNEIQLAVELGQKNAKMTSSFNDLLHKRFLFFEIRLQFQDAFATARQCIHIVATAFALPTELANIKSTLHENGFDSFRLIGMIGMI